MDESLVFEKTPQGLAEVGTRSAGLSLQARRVLIMIDGSRTLGELAPLAPDGKLDEVIGLLRARGLIRSVNDVDATALTEAWNAGAASSPHPPPTPAMPDDRIYLTLDEVKRRAVHELNERMGPDGEPLAMRIERSSTAEELREQLHEAERLIARAIGETSAQEFVRTMRRKSA
jgi:hypothetical protein